MNILLVCTGNTCRSAMAAPLLRQRLEAAGIAGEHDVRSAGVAAQPGQPATKGTVVALQARGLDGEAHQSSLVDDSLIRWADLILTMGQSHKRAILERHMEALEKTFTLKEFVDDDPQTVKILEEMDKLQAEAQTKQALFVTEHADEIERLQQQYQERGGDPATEKELAALQQRLEDSVREESGRMMELMAQLPDYDIADPYGGQQHVYENTAREIEGLLDRLVAKVKELPLS
ncbi:MAG TPA: low molecular weight protein arginine phosphatase [Bacilli bacterium]|nr:low molecular weight protein arginine phosphatase [Bacilli bacterium]